MILKWEASEVLRLLGSSPDTFDQVVNDAVRSWGRQNSITRVMALAGLVQRDNNEGEK